MAGRAYTAAIDMGSTTIAAYILLPKDKSFHVLASAAACNPQAEHGRDVISRISYIGGDEQKLHRLQQEAVAACEELLCGMCQAEGIDAGEIQSIYFVGNPTMCHILLGYMPSSLAIAPFRHQYEGSASVRAADIRFDNLGHAMAYVIPCIAEHVGADTLAAMYVTIEKGEKGQFLLDLGTNGEMALKDGEDYYVCSAAAGPALEGGEIRQGMTAREGAITRVEWDADSEKLCIEWIGKGDAGSEKPRIEWVGKRDAGSEESRIEWIGKKDADSEKLCVEWIGKREGPVGICGSGLVDAVAVLLSLGLIEGNGRLIGAEEAGKCAICHELRRRLVRIDGENAFVLDIDREQVLALARGNEKLFQDYVHDKGHRIVYLMQSDIHALQLAKAAIYAAIQLIFKAAGKRVEEAERVYLAGAFGNDIRIESAAKIGLIPSCWGKGIVLPAGNAAGQGCCEMAYSEEARIWAEKIPEKIHHIPLGRSKFFQEYYLKAMDFN